MSEGALEGLRVLEFSALGPLTFTGMLLADLGADVVRVERPSPPGAEVTRPRDLTLRGRKHVVLDLKSPQGVATARALSSRADVLLEGNRPGVMERLGLGPEELRTANDRLIYGRLTGWGQTGKRAPTAGHDINYIALTGALAAIGERDRTPVPPLALAGDFGGGAMFLLTGICAALYRRELTGCGETIDAAMVDGANLLMSAFYKRVHQGAWIEERRSNLLDGGAPYYTTYTCADGKHVAVGCVEGKFFAFLLKELGISREEYGDRHDRSQWARQYDLLAARFGSEDRNHWDTVFAETDACVTPVLTMSEALKQREEPDRSRFFDVAGEAAPVPAPRFKESPATGVARVSTWWEPKDIEAAWGARC